MQQKRNMQDPAAGGEARPGNNMQEITSDMIENAHASGDGALEKDDENIFRREEDDKQTEQGNY